MPNDATPHDYDVLVSPDKDEVVAALCEALTFQLQPPPDQLPVVYSPKWTPAMCQLLVEHAKDLFKC